MQSVLQLVQMMRLGHPLDMLLMSPALVSISSCQPAGSFPHWISSCLQESEAFAAAAALDTHKALVHIFFAQRATKKVKGITDAGGLA